MIASLIRYVYNETNHWNALTDGLIKYVHRD